MTSIQRSSCLIVAGCLMLLAVPAQAQSFNCHQAFFPDERTICENPSLARLDSELASLFGRVMSRVSQAQRPALKREETAWVVARRGCRGDGACIADFYRRRIRRLDVALAANEPEGGGAVVRQSSQTRMPPEPALRDLNSPTRPLARTTPQGPRPTEAKPPAVVSTKVEPSDVPASGSAAPAPSRDLSIEPEVSPAARGSFSDSAGGPMTPDR